MISFCKGCNRMYAEWWEEKEGNIDFIIVRPQCTLQYRGVE